MSFVDTDRQRNRELFRQMSLKEKCSHIWMYYKAAFLLGAILLAILVSVIYTSVTRKEPVMYMAYTNIQMDDQTEQALWGDYLTDRGYDPEETEVSIYGSLYLANMPDPENFEQANGSYMKVMALIESKELDIILMNRESYDFCSANGYLLDLRELFSPEDSAVFPYVVSNLVILEDNTLDYSLGMADAHIYVTDTVPNALDLSRLGWYQEAGYAEEVYLGIVLNTPRLDICADYFTYLTGK